MLYSRCIFWFRQDLRLDDNTGLFEAVQSSEKVLPIFILDEHLLDKFGGLTDIKFGFIREALDELSENLKKIGGQKVIVLRGKPENIIPQLVQKYDIECVFTNTSYGTYGKMRDGKVIESISKLGCKFESHKDFLLVEPQEIEQRKVFTPYFKLWQKFLIAHPENLKILLKLEHFSQLHTQEQTESKDFISHERHPYFTMEFGRERLEKHILRNYSDVRNDLDTDGTSRLSPYLRFGVFSVRQIYARASGFTQHLSQFSPDSTQHLSLTLSCQEREQTAASSLLQEIKMNGALLKKETPWGGIERGVSGANTSFISELAWREFWWHILYYFPNTKNQEFQEKRRHIEWSQDTEMFGKWCRGETGYPIVDAAMRQLNETNWMHGRARMVVASFLTKDMHIDWRLGERYFAEKLLDYDEAVNLGNWQWSASVGADPKPLRVFSPMLQSEKFDREAKFIKRYIPELEFESVKAIHNPLEIPLSYCPTIIDHRIETHKARELYKEK